MTLYDSCNILKYNTPIGLLTEIHHVSVKNLKICQMIPLTDVVSLIDNRQNFFCTLVYVQIGKAGFDSNKRMSHLTPRLRESSKRPPLL